jgi:hypothetical protein
MFLTLISLAVVGVVSFAGSRSWAAREADDAGAVEAEADPPVAAVGAV